MKVDLMTSVKGLSGSFGDVVFRQVNGKTFMASRPAKKKGRRSKAQVTQQIRFAEAVGYAKRILADPCYRFVYEAMARERGRRADKLLTSDFLTAPVVELIELSGYGGKAGDVIRVIASDDVEVVSVEVTIQRAGGEIVEQGPATKRHGVWDYTATGAAPRNQKLAIIAIARDRPGNEGRGMVERE